MTIHIELSQRAFRILESLPQKIGFDLFQLIDTLSKFPEIGSPMGTRFPKYSAFRQLIYKRKLRIIYAYDRDSETVNVLSILDCRQTFPDPDTLTPDNPNPGLPLK